MKFTYIFIACKINYFYQLKISWDIQKLGKRFLYKTNRTNISQRLKLVLDREKHTQKKEVLDNLGTANENLIYLNLSIVSLLMLH